MNELEKRRRLKKMVNNPELLEEIKNRIKAKEQDDLLRTDALLSRIELMEPVDRWKVESFIKSLEK